MGEKSKRREKADEADSYASLYWLISKEEKSEEPVAQAGPAGAEAAGSPAGPDKRAPSPGDGTSDRERQLRERVAELEAELHTQHTASVEEVGEREAVRRRHVEIGKRMAELEKAEGVAESEAIDLQKEKEELEKHYLDQIVALTRKLDQQVGAHDAIERHASSRENDLRECIGELERRLTDSRSTAEAIQAKLSDAQIRQTELNRTMQALRKREDALREERDALRKERERLQAGNRDDAVRVSGAFIRKASAYDTLKSEAAERERELLARIAELEGTPVAGGASGPGRAAGGEGRKGPRGKLQREEGETEMEISRLRGVSAELKTRHRSKIEEMTKELDRQAQARRAVEQEALDKEREFLARISELEASIQAATTSTPLSDGGDAVARAAEDAQVQLRDLRTETKELQKRHRDQLIEFTARLDEQARSYIAFERSTAQREQELDAAVQAQNERIRGLDGVLMEARAHLRDAAGEAPPAGDEQPAKPADSSRDTPTP